MRITGFHVGGFGLLSDLEVGGLGPGTTVVVGPNEAGKSHLHTFLVRTMFGHPRANDARGRDRHEPLRGGRHGGVVSARDSDGGSWGIHRYTTGSPVLRVVKPDGTESTTGESLGELLGRGMDEDRFEQVFAIDLDALASLGSLEGNALDALLLDAATVGAGRSLRGAIADLRERRDALWTSRGRNPPLNAALAERREAEKRLREAQERANSYQAAQEEVARLRSELDRVRTEQEQERAEIRRLQRLRELWPTWEELTDAEARLDEASEVVVADSLAEQVADWERKHNQKVQAAEAAQSEADRLEAAAAAITVDDALQEVGDRVADHVQGAALQGDRRRRLEQATAELRSAKQAAADAVEAMPAGWDAGRVAQTPADATLPPSVRRIVDRLQTAEQELAAAAEAVEAATERLAAARRAANTSSEATRDEPQGDVRARQVAVGALRSALPDLERAEAGGAAPASIPRWVPVAAAVLTIALLITTGVAMATGAVAVGVAALIAAALSGIVTAGVWRGTSGGAIAARPTDGLSAPDLRQQVIEAGRALGLSPPITRRELEAANLETEALAEERRRWEERRTAAERDSAAVQREEEALGKAEVRHAERESAVESAREAWQDGAQQAGLDPEMDPSAAPELLTAIGEARRALQAADHIERTHNDLARDVQAFDHTTRELCAAVGRGVGDNPDAALARLAEDCDADTDARSERTRLLDAAEQKRQEATDLDGIAQGLQRDLQAAYEQVGAADAETFAAAVAADIERRAAQHDRDRADRTLRQHLGDDDQAEQLRAELATGRVTTWADKLADHKRRSDELEEERDEFVRQHTTAEQELRVIGDDDAVVAASSEVEQLTQRCRELAEEWATADLAAGLLSATLERFEKAHQPTVLEEAGSLLAQVTADRWTGVRRIDDDLYVAADGDPVPAHALSRGATEQLYLCLRLALAEELNRHGVRLPLLIDDLMANSDPDRADALSRVLTDVATRQQLILFTCNPATADRMASADPAAGVLAISAAGSTATWEREPSAARS